MSRTCSGACLQERDRDSSNVPRPTYNYISSPTSLTINVRHTISGVRNLNLRLFKVRHHILGHISVLLSPVGRGNSGVVVV